MNVQEQLLITIRAALLAQEYATLSGILVSAVNSPAWTENTATSSLIKMAWYLAVDMLSEKELGEKGSVGDVAITNGVSAVRKSLPEFCAAMQSENIDVWTSQLITVASILRNGLVPGWSTSTGMLFGEKGNTSAFVLSNVLLVLYMNSFQKITTYLAYGNDAKPKKVRENHLTIILVSFYVDFVLVQKQEGWKTDPGNFTIDAWREAYKHIEIALLKNTLYTETL